MGVALEPIIVGAVAGGSAASVVSAFAGPLMGPDERNNTMFANVGRPNQYPTMDVLVSAYTRGFLDTDEFIKGAGLNAVTVANANDTRMAWTLAAGVPGDTSTRAGAGAERYQAMGELWRAVLDSKYVYPDLSTVLQAYHRGFFEPAQLEAHMLRAGAKRSAWAPFLQAFAAVPTIGPLYEARWRGIITPERFDYWLTRQGYSDDEARRIIAAPLQQIPGISDIIRFAVREAFSPDVAVPAGYYREFPQAVQEWAAKQGFGWETGQTIEQDGQQINLTPAHWYWAAHWQPLSPSQSYVMLHRLRPGRTQRYAEMIRTPANPNPVVSPFTMEDVQRWLRISDYPVSVRNQLAAISYSVMRLVDIRAVYKLIPGRRQWAIDQLLDRGYIREDALQTVALWTQQNQEAEQRTAQRETDRATAQLVKQAREGYRIGAVNGNDLRASLTAIGFSADAIDMIISVEDNAARLTHIKSVIRRVQMDIRSGSLTEQQGRDALIAAGVQQIWAAQYAERARLSITPRRQQASTTQILKAVSRGFLPAAVAQVRLANLGWTNPDIALLLPDAVGQLNQAQAKMRSEQQRATERRVKGLEAARRQAKAIARQVESDLRRIQPIATIKKLLDSGVISERTAIARLAAQAYPSQAIAESLALWRKERASKSERNGEGEKKAGPEPTTPASAD